MTRLGFVGVGKHAQKLAAVFRELGGEIVCHARAGSEPADGFGELVVHWPHNGPDTWIAAATPSMNTAVAVCCAESKLRCLVSKPLLLTDATHGASHVSVDLWRLWSPSWQALKQAVAGQRISSVRVAFTGSGPHRTTHNGALDYGPHAFAFVHDLLGELSFRSVESSGLMRLPEPHNTCWIWHGNAGDVPVVLKFGNGDLRPQMMVRVKTERGCFWWHEACGTQHFNQPGVPSLLTRNEDALRLFCAAWLRGETDRTLQLSCMGMRCLKGLT